MTTSDTATDKLYALLTELRQHHLEMGKRIEEISRIVKGVTGTDPLVREVAMASPGLRELLRELMKRGGSAQYTELHEALNCSPASLGARRSRTPLGVRLIIETREPEDYRYSIPKEYHSAVQKGLAES